MGATDHEPDPSKRIPTAVWLFLGLAVVVAFAVLAIAMGGHTQHKAVGPPAGSPQGAPPAIVDKQAD